MGDRVELKLEAENIPIIHLRGWETPMPSIDLGKKNLILLKDGLEIPFRTPEIYRTSDFLLDSTYNKSSCVFDICE